MAFSEATETEQVYDRPSRPRLGRQLADRPGDFGVRVTRAIVGELLRIAGER